MVENSKPATAAPIFKRKTRIVGVDAARGLALIGMIAVHVLPDANGANEPTLTWVVSSGVASALFSFLAGLSLALTSGGSMPVLGTALNGVRVSTGVRGVLLIVLGMLLAIVDPPAGIILSYYGVMFLLAIPLLNAGVGTLFALAAAFAVLGGTFIHFTGASFPGLDGYDPSIASLLTQPGATLSALFLTGTYPAVAWMAFICAGLAVGRVNLSKQDIQLRLIVGGLLTALITWVVSFVSRDILGGFDRILYSVPGLTEGELVQSLTWGTGDSTPEITSGWWLLMLSPYSETPIEILNTLGTAVFVFGAVLLIGSRIGWLVIPLALIGTMTLTLYSVHLLFIATGLLEGTPYVSFWLQFGVAMLFVVLWRIIGNRVQGPLEWAVAQASGWSRDRYLARPGKM